jgi:hypothetical protein
MIHQDDKYHVLQTIGSPSYKVSVPLYTTIVHTVLFRDSLAVYDGNDEISMPGSICSTSRIIFLYIEGSYISKQDSSKSGSNACSSPFDSRVVCQVVSRHLCWAVLQMRFSVVEKSWKELIQI